MTGLAGHVRGLDGKTYPGRRRDLEQWTAVAHSLAHEGRSVRQVVAAFAELGNRVSVGTVHYWLTGWRCPDCPTVQVRNIPHLNTSTGGPR